MLGHESLPHFYFRYLIRNFQNNIVVKSLYLFGVIQIN